MELNFAALEAAKLEQPTLRLQTMSGEELGIIPFVHGLKFTLNYTDVSEIEFTVPIQANGIANPVYDKLTSYRVVYTDALGIYIITSPKKSGNGITEEKTVHGYSIEQTFADKLLFLEGGTFPFYNDKNGIYQEILALDTSWGKGNVASRLYSTYRTFDDYYDDALSFCYGDAAEKYRCAFVFDVYARTINVIDIDADNDVLPIYLDYDNLLSKVQVEEITDNLVTKLYCYGADDLTIRGVNPTGRNYIVNLNYFLANGDLDIASSKGGTIAAQYREWQYLIKSNQAIYSGYSSASASLTAQKTMYEVELVEVQYEKTKNVNTQSALIQGMATTTNATSLSSLQSEYNKCTAKIAECNDDIADLQSEIAALAAEINAYTAKKEAINDKCEYTSFFSTEDQKVLDRFMIEDTLEDDTFVATSVDTSVSGSLGSVSGTVKITGCSKVQMATVDTSSYSTRMYMITGGSVSIANMNFESSIVRGTLDYNTSTRLATMSLYLNTAEYTGNTYNTGMLTITGTATISSDLHTETSYLDDEKTYSISENIATYLTIYFSSGSSFYFTTSVTDYYEYSVELELYEHCQELLDDYAWPEYEFSLDSSNFIYEEKFAPFKNAFQLGHGIYINIASDGVMNSRCIGVTLDYDNPASFKMTFVNGYRLKNGVEQWISELQASAKSSRSFDTSKYIYDNAADYMTEVSTYMNSMLNAAVQTITAAKDMNVVIDGTGINITGSGDDSKYSLRLTDRMIAISDDGWTTASLAIGYFSFVDTALEGTKNYENTPVWGINAELVAGKLLMGEALILQGATLNGDGITTGKYSVQIDSTGVWLYNSRIILESDTGRIMIHPDYGIAAGYTSMFSYTTNGTNIIPSFIADDGSVITDNDDMPKNVNFYIGLNGDAYFRGTLYSTEGHIGGFTITSDELYSSKSDNYSIYLNSSYNNEGAIWCGAANWSSAKFYILKNGKMKATDGEFEGEITSSKIQGGSLNGTSITGGTISGTEIHGDGIFGGTITGTQITASNMTTTNIDTVTINGSRLTDSALTGDTVLTGTLSSGTSTVSLDADGDIESITNKTTSSWELDPEGWLEGCGIKVGSNSKSTTGKGYNFYVDRSGNMWTGGSVYITGSGNLNLYDGAITFAALSDDAKSKLAYDDTNLNNAITAVKNAVSDVESAVKAAQAVAEEANKAASSAQSTADDVSSTIQPWVYTDTTTIDGSMIATGTIIASHIAGGTVFLMYEDTAIPNSSYVGGKIYIRPSSSSAYALEIESLSGFQLTAGSTMFLTSGYGSYIQLDAMEICLGSAGYNSPSNVVPNINAIQSLGIAYQGWKEVWANSSEINTSDRNLKNSIEEISDQYIDLFYKLTPVRYKYNDGESGRYHIGYISQDVEEALEQAGIDSKCFAGFVKDQDKSGNDLYFLRYPEFIALNTAAIQHQKQIIDAQASTISSLEERIARLEAMIASITD